MQRVVTYIDDRLAEAGDSVQVAGHLDQTAYGLGGHDFSVPAGMDYDLMLTNAGDGILATGMIKCHVVGTCDRCLDAAEFDVEGEVDEYYLFKAPTQESQADDEDEVDFSLVGEDQSVDLTDALASAVLMETPYIVLCREDCKGLCPVCGANLNHEDCGHGEQLARERAQEKLDASPFAALRDLKLDDSRDQDSDR